jgi:hypothetical protein
MAAWWAGDVCCSNSNSAGGRPAEARYNQDLIDYTGGGEQPIEHLRSGTPEDEILGAVEDTVGKLNVPFSGMRVYRGSNLIRESFEVRG